MSDKAADQGWEPPERSFGIREDGSAHTELGLSRVSDGWRVGTPHSCLMHDAHPFG